MNQDPLFSVNRLVEFGLSMSIAQQMVRNMNQAVKAAWTPGASALPGYFVALDGKSAGPFSDSELGRLVHDQRLDASTLIWRQGLTAWRPAGDVPEVLRLVALCPPPLPKSE